MADWLEVYSQKYGNSKINLFIKYILCVIFLNQIKSHFSQKKMRLRFIYIYVKNNFSNFKKSLIKYFFFKLDIRLFAFLYV